MVVHVGTNCYIWWCMWKKLRFFAVFWQNLKKKNEKKFALRAEKLFHRLVFIFMQMMRPSSLKSILKNRKNNILIYMQVEFSTHLLVFPWLPRGSRRHTLPRNATKGGVRNFTCGKQLLHSVVTVGGRGLLEFPKKTVTTHSVMD